MIKQRVMITIFNLLYFNFYNKLTLWFNCAPGCVESLKILILSDESINLASVVNLIAPTPLAPSMNIFES